MTKYLNPSRDKESDGTKFFVDWNYHKQVIAMKCIFEHGFINALKFQHALFVRFSKIGSTGSDSNCKRLLVYCVSVVDASPKMFNGESS